MKFSGPDRIAFEHFDQRISALENASQSTNGGSMNREELDEHLGNTYKDKISDFQGPATGVCRYLTGCDQVLLSGKVGNDGHVKTIWLDVQRLQKVDAERIVLDNGETPGFDVAPPVR